MLDSNVESKISFYSQPRFVDDPFHPAGFKGTFAFSDHNLIPEIFFDFLQRHFGQYKIRRIPLDKINEILNELWEGPGSLEKIFRLAEEMKASGKEIKFTAADIASIKAKKDEDEEDNLPPLDIEFEQEEDY